MNQENSSKFEKLERTQNKKTYQTPKISFECPTCHWILKCEKPDNKHPIPSVKKPERIDIKSNILIKKHICRNPRCQKEINVFWFEPKDFYTRI
jgi:rubredoxin